MIVSSGKDIYTDKNGVLINSKGFSDAEALEEAASLYAAMVSKHIRSLSEIRIKAWDIEFYKELHKVLLGGIYPWAGELRKVDIGRPCDHVAYEPWQNIEAKITAVFSFINEWNLFKDKSDVWKILDLAIVFSNLKNIQPFREGSTCTALLFTSLLARQSGMAIDWSLLDIKRFSMYQVEARYGDLTNLVIAFSEITAQIDELPYIHAPLIIADGKEHDLVKEIIGSDI